MEALPEARFVLKERVRRLQWKLKGIRDMWSRNRHDFKIEHGHPKVFRKLMIGEFYARIKYSGERQ